MLLPILAMLTGLASAQSAPLLVPDSTYLVDQSLKDAGIAYKGLPSGRLYVKVTAYHISSATLDARFKRLPEKSGMDRYELLVKRLTVKSRRTDDVSKALAGKPLIAFDAGKEGQFLEKLGEADRNPNHAFWAKAELELDENAKHVLKTQLTDVALSAHAWTLSPKWGCLADLEGKPVGAKWERPFIPGTSQICEFKGWAMVKGRKIAVVAYSTEGIYIQKMPPKWVVIHMTYVSKGTYYFDPATQEILRESYTDWSMDPPTTLKEGFSSAIDHTYAE